MDIFRGDSHAAERKAFVAVTFSDIDDIPINISSDYEYGILMAADTEPFALTDRVELGPVMMADNLTERVLLVTYFLDMLLSLLSSLKLNSQFGVSFA